MIFSFLNRPSPTLGGLWGYGVRQKISKLFFQHVSSEFMVFEKIFFLSLGLLRRCPARPLPLPIVLTRQNFTIFLLKPSSVNGLPCCAMWFPTGFVTAWPT